MPLREPNEPFGGEDGSGGYAPLAEVVGGSIYWVQGNHLGVPVMFTDASGAAASPSGFTVVGGADLLAITASFIAEEQ